MKWDEGIGGGQRGTERGGGGGRKAEKEGCEGRVGCEVLSQFWSWIHCLTNMWSEFCFEAKERRDYTVVLNTQVTHRMDAHSLHTWFLARSLGGFGVAWTSFLSRGCCWVVLGNPGPWDPVLIPGWPTSGPVGFWPWAPNQGRPSFSCWNGCVNLIDMCGVRSSVLLGAANFQMYFNKA